MRRKYIHSTVCAASKFTLKDDGLKNLKSTLGKKKLQPLDMGTGTRKREALLLGAMVHGFWASGCSADSSNESVRTQGHTPLGEERGRCASDDTCSHQILGCRIWLFEELALEKRNVQGHAPGEERGRRASGGTCSHHNFCDVARVNWFD